MSPYVIASTPQGWATLAGLLALTVATLRAQVRVLRWARRQG